ncbi:hypothetical protein [uncultured Muribaculum sp.]|uniref:hypothetical protein n=1 Tax=uncultured Muribaculum sp. TaxID=1918613 RepID=UPI0025B3EF5A|nr:hypothetical protein [uncultured Muribaculum sp.]
MVKMLALQQRKLKNYGEEVTAEYVYISVDDVVIVACSGEYPENPTKITFRNGMELYVAEPARQVAAYINSYTLTSK